MNNIGLFTEKGSFFWSDEQETKPITLSKVLARRWGLTLVIKERRGSRWYKLGMVHPNGLYEWVGKQKDYYVLPIDHYGQPKGYVNTKPMIRGEYLHLVERGAFVFDSRIAAVARAMD